MTEPTLQEVFGAGATQSGTTLTISKVDFPTLTAAADNRAEQLFVAILLKAETALTTTRQDSNPEQSITVEDSFQSLTTRNNQQYRQITKSVNLQKLDNTAGIDPDDY